MNYCNEFMENYYLTSLLNFLYKNQYAINNFCKVHKNINQLAKLLFQYSTQVIVLSSWKIIQTLCNIISMSNLKIIISISNQNYKVKFMENHWINFCKIIIQFHKKLLFQYPIKIIKLSSWKIIESTFVKLLFNFIKNYYFNIQSKL